MAHQKPETEVQKSTRQQLFRNPDIQPTGDVLAEALGEADKVYMKFVSDLANRDIQLAWRYYTDGKAWLAKGLYKWTGVRGGQKETTAFWLSIWEGFFKASIFIPEKSRADINNLPLDDQVKHMIAASKQMGNKLKFFPLVFDFYSDSMFESFFTLVDFKIKSSMIRSR